MTEQEYTELLIAIENDIVAEYGGDEDVDAE